MLGLRMKTLCSFKTAIVFLIATFKQTNADDRRKIELSQAAVTSPAGLEDLYVRIKKEFSRTYLDGGTSGNLNEKDYIPRTMKSSSRFNNYFMGSDLENEKEYDLEDKSEICFRIFSSGFFEWLDEEVVQFGLKATETMEVLGQKYTDIYNEIYQGWPDTPPDQWLNPIKPRNVSVGEKKFQEKVFRCLTRKRQSEHYTLTEYFVSAIYQSEGAPNLMDGRFIFVSNESNELKLFAIAEEVGTVDKQIFDKTFEKYFTHYESYKSQSRSEPDVCNLSAADKIRLCAIVLNATGFPDKIKFVPTPDHVELDCKTNKVLATFKNTEHKRMGFSHPDEIYEKMYKIKYEDSMIGCKGTPVSAYNLPPISYYISRGLFSCSVMVFEQDGTVYLPYVGVTNVQLTIGAGEFKSVSATVINSAFLNYFHGNEAT